MQRNDTGNKSKRRVSRRTGSDNYTAGNAMKRTEEIYEILRSRFGKMPEASLSAAALDLHDIAWECERILKSVEAIHGGKLSSEEIFQRIIDILVGIESHINRSHLRSLKRFSKAMDVEDT